jgi:hypothetical protein
MVSNQNWHKIKTPGLWPGVFILIKGKELLVKIKILHYIGIKALCGNRCIGKAV